MHIVFLELHARRGPRGRSIMVNSVIIFVAVLDKWQCIGAVLDTTQHGEVSHDFPHIETLI